MNAPVIDLEGLAKHRGSALGHLSINSNQPTQQQFENDLANAYVKVKHHPTIIVEIEQNIGSIQMPQHLRKHIYNSDIVLIERDFEDRVQHIAAEYAPAWSDADDAKFQAGILLLKKHIKSEIYQQILTHVQRREFHDAIRLLMIHRYDQCYDKTIKRQTASIIATINMSTEGSLAQKRLLSLTSSESNPGID
jgi:tRNA 2-selenouridine synthase